ncbi:PREDICTED: uncharacterized protein At4g30180 [Tarenaya hassleriana]|uniref:uncharacterized protein At4g30180 n=1 Tax=Tarenaya hassleriana TaxID=28532 RepID=UPI00053C9E65|nr:PREDICTED: uncharacterized protein At4g30180 [Tarenaya hassleriana]
MEWQTNKRKRVFSLEPNRNPTAVFARKYADRLVPALKKMAANKPSSRDHHLQSKFERYVKHEVDMALALSAQDFAWSRFLRQKLSCPNDITTSTTSSSSPQQTLGFDEMKFLERSQENGEEEERGGEIRKRLRELQKLLPGGEEMGVEETLSEIGSYIVCLELQMIVLKSLVQEP